MSPLKPELIANERWPRQKIGLASQRISYNCAQIEFLIMSYVMRKDIFYAKQGSKFRQRQTGIDMTHCFQLCVRPRVLYVISVSLVCMETPPSILTHLKLKRARQCTFFALVHNL